MSRRGRSSSAFADGSRLESAGGKLITTNDDGTTQVPVDGSGNTNRVTKWLNGAAGTLTDSAITETGGNVGIGTQSPARRLHVSNAMRLQPVAGPPASPSSGDLYFDTSEALCIFVGGVWAKLAGPGTCN